MQHIQALYGKAQRWLVSFWTEYKWCILSGVIVGLIAYMFTFTNKLPNHDDVFFMFEKGATIEIGRWGLELLSCIFPDYSMPWIYGLITLMCLSVSAGLIAYTFRIHGKLPQVLLGGLIVVFPTMIGVFSYMFMSSSFAFAFLLATLAFVLVSRDRNPVKNAVLGTLLMILSLSIYQAYISLTVSLLVVYLIQKLIKTDASAKDIVLSGIRYICFALAALVLYYGITRLILSALSMDMSEYAQKALSNTSDNGILARIRMIFAAPLYILFKGLYGLTPSRFSKCLHALCLLLTGIQLLRWLLSSKSKKRRWLLPLLLRIRHRDSPQTLQAAPSSLSFLRGQSLLFAAHFSHRHLHPVCSILGRRLRTYSPITDACWQMASSVLCSTNAISLRSSPALNIFLS